tara:strand:- start:8032 stop:8223 length:192 start_codon:yes stop_codon:yes gene_type:complete
MSIPDAYAVCPVCGIHIDVKVAKDAESFTNEEAIAHIVQAHPEVCNDGCVPYIEIYFRSEESA